VHAVTYELTTIAPTEDAYAERWREWPLAHAESSRTSTGPVVMREFGFRAEHVVETAQRVPERDQRKGME
jgi:hypothetical protein